MLTKLKDTFSALPLPTGRIKPQWLMAAGGVLLVAAIVFSLWRSNQGYVALYGSDEKLPVAQVVEVLGAESIAYRINPDNGQILVPEDKLPRARMALAAKGITAVMPDGYELMDKDEMLGSSQFVQNVRYKRSLEGELARSIMALDPVENARVHLGLSESSSFVMTNKPQSSASVMLQLRYGKHLDEQQVAAIVQLVAGACRVCSRAACAWWIRRAIYSRKTASRAALAWRAFVRGVTSLSASKTKPPTILPRCCPHCLATRISASA